MPVHIEMSGNVEKIIFGDISATDIRFQNDILNRIAAGGISVFDEKVRMEDIRDIKKIS